MFFFYIVFSCLSQGTTAQSAPEEPLLQPEQRSADRRAHERPPVVFATVRKNNPGNSRTREIPYTLNTKLMNRQFLFKAVPHDAGCCHISRHVTSSCGTRSCCLLGFCLSFRIVQNPLLLSDSCLHLFLQSQLSATKMQACAAGKTHYSVEQAVNSCGLRRFHSEEDLQKDVNTSCDTDSDRLVRLPSLLIPLHPKKITT